MSHQIAVGQCSTEEDLDIEWSFASGYDPAGKTLEVLVRERASATIKATLTVGSGLTIVGAAVKAKVAKATMAAWARTEYSADLVDKTGGALKRLVPTRITFDEPGKLVGGVSGNAFHVTQAGTRFVVTATYGPTGPVGPATTLTIGTVTDIAPGNPPSASLTGPAGAQVLNLGLVRGTPGSGAPDSPDILAIAEKDRLERSLAAAGVPDEPSLIVDFIRGVHFAAGAFVGASILSLVAALAGSSYTRASTATYFDSDGLMKTAASGVPRIDYDPAMRVRRGLLMEPSRTNILTYSTLLAGDVIANDADRTSGASKFADGTDTMSRITSTINGGANTCFFQAVGGVPDDTVTRTFSAFIRRGATPESGVAFGYYGGAVQLEVYAIIDWSTATIAGSGNPSLVACGAGLFRVSITMANNASGNTGTYCRLYVRGSDPANVIGDYVDTAGWQIEEGSAPSSYIPTAGSAATRAADDFQLGSAPWFNAAGFTALAEFAHSAVPAGAPVALTVGEPGAGFGTSAYLLRDATSVGAYPESSPVHLQVTVADSTSLSVRAVLRLQANAAALAVNGSAVSTDAANAMPVGDVRMTVGAGAWDAPSNHLNGHIRRIMVWGALSDAKVQALSNPAWS